jgi:hypothetical protein
VEVEVAVHAAEESLLRSATASGAKHEEVVAAAFEFSQDLLSHMTAPLYAMSDHIVGNGSACLA